VYCQYKTVRAQVSKGTWPTPDQRIATFGQNKHRGEVSNGKDEKQFAGNGKSHFILQFMS
jgi:hypothetical protein